MSNLNIDFNNDHVANHFKVDRNGFENQRHEFTVITTFPKSKADEFATSLEDIEGKLLGYISSEKSGHFQYFIYDCNEEIIKHSDLIMRW